MALTGTPEKRNNRPLETWLNSLSPDARGEAEEYMRDTKNYAHEELKNFFAANGYTGSEKPIARWRRKAGL